MNFPEYAVPVLSGEAFIFKIQNNLLPFCLDSIIQDYVHPSPLKLQIYQASPQPHWVRVGHTKWIYQNIPSFIVFNLYFYQFYGLAAAKICSLSMHKFVTGLLKMQRNSTPNWIWSALLMPRNTGYKSIAVHLIPTFLLMCLMAASLGLSSSSEPYSILSWTNHSMFSISSAFLKRNLLNDYCYDEFIRDVFNKWGSRKYIKLTDYISSSPIRAKFFNICNLFAHFASYSQFWSLHSDSFLSIMTLC